MTRINRLPAKLETLVGAVAAAVLSSPLGYGIWYVLRAARRRPELLTSGPVAALVVLFLVFAWSSALLLRIVFGSPGLPSFRGQAVLGYLMTAAGIALCGISFFSHRPTQNFLRGVVAICLGIFWAVQARKAMRQRA